MADAIPSEILSFVETIQYSLARTTGEQMERFEVEAQDILAMPEMHAIKAELRHGWCCDECIAGQMGERGVPQTVIDWALS